MTGKLRSIAAVERSRRRPTLLDLGWAPLGALLVWLGAAACQPDDSSETASEPGAAPGAPAAVADTASLQRQMELMTELRAIDQALAPLRARAQEDAGIHAQEQALVAQVDAAMESISPGVIEARQRFEALRGDFAAAQQAGDEERARSLGMELQGLQTRLQETQSAALSQGDVAASIETFRNNLFEWMRAADPQADSLLDRAEAITDELERLTPPSEG